ncbi:hypothetical protein BJ875DRAFT_472824 [Amylocarpus encephaloides]|uniref:Uncharacterized protein n=1 Tax=Amylocarpus encephaloides TaxID=45428 RepID=A0A9P7YAR4_9HELO|nr:hypothetical protein BJ875DRAFT_472824 [Amylocarpus encephaloides]
MHTDVSPLTAIRGRCDIKHKNEVDKLDDLRRTKDSFWFEKLYDRYIHRFFDIVPTKSVINVPAVVKKVLDERWRYIIVEPGRGKELTTPSKSCKRCKGYCANNDAVDCAICKCTYHMSCVSPPLLRKPTRGFAWACGPCSKAQAKRLEARNTPTIMDHAVDGEDDDANDDEEGSPDVAEEANGTSSTSPTKASVGATPLQQEAVGTGQENRGFIWRYLGIHCNVEDALDADDRIHPRASSRLGPKHQANVSNWPGRPVEYVKAPEIKKKYVKGAGQKKDTKFSKETVASLEADKLAREQRPKWVMDEPPGYVHRGDDYDNDDPRSTAQLLYKLPAPGELSPPSNDPTAHADTLDEPTRVRLVHEYVCRAVSAAKPLYNLPEMSTNALDVAVETLRANSYDADKALEAMHHLDKRVFREPTPSPAELKKFEDAVSKYGSEWHSIKRHVKTMSAADVVRFYYTWKKSDRGKHVWGNYHARKGKKEAKRLEVSSIVGTVKLQDDVADDHDDSAFDNDKAFEKKRGFQCKFCSIRSSRQWRRAPSTPAGTTTAENPSTKASGKDKGAQLMVALCRRCAELWRRYGIQWEPTEEVQKKVQANGGRAWKRKIDEEILKELVAANEISNGPIAPPPTVAPASNGAAPAPSAPLPNIEPPRKKAKSVPEPEVVEPVMEPVAVAPPVPKKKVVPEKLPPPPPPPEPPKPKTLPCAICGEIERVKDQLLACRECRMSVHRNCYGVVGDRSPAKWTCDMCSNDKNPQVSIQYKCMLCPVDYTEHDFVEPPKISHKKKSEKEREKDRLERVNAQKVADFFQKKQEDLNKPVNPREPLKRTANNNWVHVTCAVFTPEVKFGNAKALEPSEGIPSIASARYQETCKACKQKGGACVACHSCRAPVHVECARHAGYFLGFDVTPVKGSRKEPFGTVNINGESATIAAVIWCKEHIPAKTATYQMSQIVDKSGLNAIQLYVQNFKQADLTLTGTVRKATLVNQSTKVVNTAPSPAPTNRRASTTNTHGNHATGRNSISNSKSEESTISSAPTSPVEKMVCATCQADVSPKWWEFPPDEVVPEPAVESKDGILGNGQNPLEHNAALAAAALHQDTKPQGPKEFQCHKCHFRKVRREPTPAPPPPPLAPPAPAPLREEPRLPASAAHTDDILSPDVDMPNAPPYQPWPPAPTFTNNASYNWSRHSPGMPPGGRANHVNGNHSPRLPASSVSPNGHNHTREPGSMAPPSSPRNGPPSFPSIGMTHAPDRYPPSRPTPADGESHYRPYYGGLPSVSMGVLANINGVQNHMPPSPSVIVGPHHPSSYQDARRPPLANGDPSYRTFYSPVPTANHGPVAEPYRQPSSHLTNGGPPPRAPEHPFSHSTEHYHPPTRAPPQASPPLNREGSHMARENSNNLPNGQASDGRVNGGASASPSLRNLLS